MVVLERIKFGDLPKMQIDDRTARILMYDIATGILEEELLVRAGYHEPLRWRLRGRGVHPPERAVRGYWFPKKGLLVLYEVETGLTKMLRDPSEDLFGLVATKMGIHREVAQLAVVGE